MAKYDLKLVKQAAQKLDIEYRGRNVGRDIANLGYDLNDVARCLGQLSPDDFHKSHEYENQPPDDAYICKYYKNPGEDEFDNLYIKFCILDGYLVIDLASFHLPR